VRMPRWFHTMDIVLCFFYMVEYIANLYIS